MTTAVCLECGTIKGGAWSACPACGFRPAGHEQLAKALLLCDSCRPLPELEQMAARRRAGEPWVFEPGGVALFADRLANLVPLTPEGYPAPPPPKTDPPPGPPGRAAPDA